MKGGGGRERNSRKVRREGNGSTGIFATLPCISNVGMAKYIVVCTYVYSCNIVRVRVYLYTSSAVSKIEISKESHTDHLLH